MKITLPLIVLLAGACAPSSEPSAAEGRDAPVGAGGEAKAAAAAHDAPAIDLAHYRMVDMTHAFTSDAPYWPTAGEGFTLKQDSYGMTEGGYFYSSNSFSAPEHGGTHLDAPIHFAEHGWTADQVPLD